MRSIAIAVALVLTATASALAAEQATPTTTEPRVIDLEMAGVGRFFLDGEEVRTLPVMPGEQVLFRVDNTSSTELGFEVGTTDEICDPSQTPRKTIPAWAEGTRELSWWVPKGAVHRRWGHRGRYCSLGTFSVGAEAPAGRAATPPRRTGPGRVWLARSEWFIRFEADFEGATSAVVWQKPDDPWRTLYLSRSDHVGFRDFTTDRLADDVEDWSVAVCGGDAVVGYVVRAPDDDRRLWLTRVPRKAGGAASVEVRAPLGERSAVDVACRGARAYVTWKERVAGESHAYLRSTSLPRLELSAAIDVGIARGRVSVAATAKQALVVWKDDGRRVRLGRFRLDGGDDARLVRESIGTVARRGSDPMIDDDGRRVAVAYTRGDVAFIETSRDGGASFDRRERFGRGRLEGTPWEFESLAVHGRDIVAALVVYYGGDAWDRQRLRSRDLGRGWTRTRIGDPVAAIPRDGFLVTPGGVKVAEAYTDGEYADTFDLRVRRER